MEFNVTAVGYTNTSRDAITCGGQKHEMYGYDRLCPGYSPGELAVCTTLSSKARMISPRRALLVYIKIDYVPIFPSKQVRWRTLDPSVWWDGIIFDVVRHRED